MIFTYVHKMKGKHTCLPLNQPGARSKRISNWHNALTTEQQQVLSGDLPELHDLSIGNLWRQAYLALLSLLFHGNASHDRTTKGVVVHFLQEGRLVIATIRKTPKKCLQFSGVQFVGTLHLCHKNLTKTLVMKRPKRPINDQ